MFVRSEQLFYSALFHRRSEQIAEHHNAKKLFFNSLPLRPAWESQFEKLTHHSEPWFSLSFEALEGFRGGWKVETCRKYHSFDEISSEKSGVDFEKAEMQDWVKALKSGGVTWKPGSRRKKPAFYCTLNGMWLKCWGETEEIMVKEVELWTYVWLTLITSHKDLKAV